MAKAKDLNQQENNLQEENQEQVMENENAEQPVEEPVEKQEEVKEEMKEETKETTELEKLQAENKELQDKLLRQYAEFDNYKKRTQKEKEELAGYAKAMCIQSILSVLDNFERALSCECQDAEFKKGMEMIFNQMQEALKAQGLEEIEALNQEFNPDLHNAISQVEDENFGENIVCNVYQKGYKVGDRVIRHAMVVVANP